MPPLTRTMADIKDKRDAETDKILEEFYDGRLIRSQTFERLISLGYSTETAERMIKLMARWKR